MIQRSSLLQRHGLPWLFLLLGLCWPLQAHAKSSLEVKLTGEQRLLYKQAIKAYTSKKYQKSIDLLSRALTVGEVDLFYFGLGRAYFKLNKCKQAQESYERAQKAPRTKTDVQDAIKRGMEQLQKECKGSLFVTCSDKNTMVSIDNAPPQSCPIGGMELAPGKHALNATLSSLKEARIVEVKAMQVRREHVALMLPKREAPPAPKGPDPWRERGLWTMLTGGVLLSSALVLDLTWTRSTKESLELTRTRYKTREELLDANDTYQLSRTTTLVLGAVGAVTTVLGGIWFLTSQSPTTGVELSLDPSSGESSVGVWYRW